jgi:hypothetical protein
MQITGRWCREILDPAQDPAHIAIDRRQRLRESDREDSPCGVGSDPGQRSELGFRSGDAAVIVAYDQLGGGMQVTGTRVVAETGPEAE